MKETCPNCVYSVMMPRLKAFHKVYEEHYCRKLKVTIEKYLAKNVDCEYFLSKEKYGRGR